MKMRIIFLSIAFVIVSTAQTYANDNILGLSNDKIRNGDISLRDVPNVISHMINFFMGIAATISVIFIIVGAYQILFLSPQQDKTRGRNTIFAALG